MKITLVNTGHFIPGLAVSPPLGVMSLASWLRSQISNVRCSIIDQSVERLRYDQLTQRIIDQGPDVVALSYMSLAASFVPEMTSKIRKALPNTFIALGGPHPSAALADGLRSTEADVLVNGEGELAFELIVRAISSGSGLDEIPGIYRKVDGQVVLNPGNSPKIADLDDLPIPAYDLIDLPKYWAQHSMGVLTPGVQRYVTMSTSRGCPYRCIYCHEVFGKSFRAQSAERVLEEIKFLHRQYSPREIFFVDDIYNLDKQRVQDISDAVTGANVKFTMHMPNAVRTDILSEDVVDAMVAMGLKTCAMALESGSKRIQKLVKKNLNIEKYLQGVEMMARRRVYTYGFNMLGFPTETAEEMRQTINTAASSMLHRAIFFKATPYPGTGLYDVARELFPEKLPALDYVHFNYHVDNNVNFSAVPDEELYHYLRIAPRIFNRNAKRLYRVIRDYPEPEVYLRAAMRPFQALRAMLGYKLTYDENRGSKRLGHEVA